MSDPATAPEPAQATAHNQLEAAQRAAARGSFLHYIRRGNGPRRAMTPQIEAALRDREV